MVRAVLKGVPESVRSVRGRRVATRRPAELTRWLIGWTATRRANGGKAKPTANGSSGPGKSVAIDFLDFQADDGGFVVPLRKRSRKRVRPGSPALAAGPADAPHPPVEEGAAEVWRLKDRKYGQARVIRLQGEEPAQNLPPAAASLGRLRLRALLARY